jgi:mannose/cellobiose epimerase-like protein (N-acyl-D-glucosamine 2-epimerase family)
MHEHKLTLTLFNAVYHRTRGRGSKVVHLTQTYAYELSLLHMHVRAFRHGSWFRVLNKSFGSIEDTKCPPGKVDYHVTGLCYDAAEVFGGDAKE